MMLYDKMLQSLCLIATFLLAMCTIVYSQALDRTHVNYRNPLQHGATCDATTLNATITAIGTNKETLFITKTDRAKVNCSWVLASNVTTNINTTLYIPTGTILSPNTGVTVAFNGPVIIDDVESLQGLGSYVFNYPQHLGISSFVYSLCKPTVPASSLTFTAFACNVRITLGLDGFNIAQTANTLGPLTGGDGVYWLAIDFSKTRTVSGWTRQSGTHYLWIKSTTRPTQPSGVLIFASTIVTSAVIASVDTTASQATGSQPVGLSLTDPALGGICDGVTDDSAALQTANNLPVGSTVLIPGKRCIIASTVTFTKAINLVGQGPKSELYLTMGTSSNGIVYDNGAANGSGTLIRGLLWRDLSIVGAPSSALNCTVQKNVIVSNFQRVYIMCGTLSSGYAMWVKGFALQNTYDLTINGALHEDPFGGVNYGFPGNGIKFTDTADVAGTFNANTVKVDFTSVAIGVWIKGQANQTNNSISGTLQALSDKAIYVQFGSEVWIHDIHAERGSPATGNDVVLEDSPDSHVGPNVDIIAGVAGQISLTILRSDRTVVDGLKGNIIKNDTSADVQIRNVVLNNIATSSVYVEAGTRTAFHAPLAFSSATTRVNGGLVDGSSIGNNGDGERWTTTSTAPPGDWAGIGGAVTWTREGTIVKQGNYSVKVSSVTTANNPTFVLADSTRLARLSNELISFTAWVYIPTAGGGDVTVQINFNSGAGTALGQTITTRDVWTPVSGSFIAGAGGFTTIAQLQFLPVSGTITFYIDAVSVIPSRAGAPVYFTGNVGQFPQYDTSITLDPGSIGAAAVLAIGSIAVPGAKVNDLCIVGAPSTLNAGLIPMCIVTGNDTVELRIFNGTGGAIDPASATWVLRTGPRL